MLRPTRHGRKPSTWLWIILIAILLVLDAGLAFMWLSAIPSPAATSQSSAQTTPTATQPPTRTVVAQAATPTRRPTRTPRPVPTIIPSPIRPVPVATPDVEPVRCEEATGRTMDATYMSQVSGTEQTYLVYLPPCYDASNRRYPSLYLIHGLYYDDTHWEKLGVFDAMDQGIHAGSYAPAIIVLPSGDDDLFSNTSGGPNSYEGEVVNVLMPTIDRLFRTDTRPQMRAIGGISRGGVWSLEIGFHDPTHFGIVGAHSACLNLNEAPPDFDPLKMTDLITLKSQRIWLDAGDADGCLPGTQDLHAALDTSHVEHTYQVYPGNHEDAFWAAHLGDYLTFYTAAWPR